ncbi:uncharacterized protein LOC132737272 [Ruditapes philippinarum]|uniref:uncharacterized protein LOC132737272 n=1 Tax=Ruditapes philippinarum TaxID=129788 RepID=UPI00295B972C|nr:uncharacterized protein LOC132737272 [Ruditapes philippinarum]
MCYYLDKQSYTIQQMSCEGTCCGDNGQDGEICCGATWSTGLIAGVCVGCIGVIVTAVAVCVYVWLTLKKKRKSGIEPQSNGNANIELQLNNNPVGHSRISIRNVSPSLSHNSHDMPPPYSPSLTRQAHGPGLNPTRPVSGHSQTSQVSCINEPDRIGKPSLQPPPYTAQTMRSPARAGRLAPHVYTFQPSPARSLAPSRAW